MNKLNSDAKMKVSAKIPPLLIHVAVICHLKSKNYIIAAQRRGCILEVLGLAKFWEALF